MPPECCMLLDEDMVDAGVVALLLDDMGADVADIGAVLADGSMACFMGVMLGVVVAGGGIWLAGRCAPLSGWLHADKDSTKVLARMTGRAFMTPPRWVADRIIKRQA